ncbi:autophagy-related protein Atg10 [Aspergillus heteromorphus CBS 117.55]|uniref:Ubiquitin-like-conjugating enzyme ATG10 n=1 Tax=Aspergillus heteromorphus CBS 117.55 TaxID=1448321 RepID=A0A317VP84_9EURO|nr:autophagy-related protein Atg10 [Aspergillus heteromorphus CBS 117.55]PWY76173.1 autophagy-related protein Atg10 [Aspergillus heteromorphus CBS 117.55]
MASSPSNQQTLSGFPLLTAEEFDAACCAFLDRVHVVGDAAVGWSSIQVHQRATGSILRISRYIGLDSSSHPDGPWQGSRMDQESQWEALEDDPEALIRTPVPVACLQVLYDVLLSPTYQVPVLYFQLREDNQPAPLEIDTVYQYLVPDQYKKELRNVGIMGGISFGYHPDSGTPAFFVHPCQTTDAMRRIAEQQCVTPEAYLIIWLGLVGNRLGLQLPKELFTTESMPKFQGAM